MKLEDLIQSKPVTEEPKNVEPIADENLSPYLLEDAEVVGYPDKEMQRELYQYATTGVLPLVLDSSNPMSIVDIGCGRGDLRAYVRENYNAEFDYHGFDFNEIMQRAAKEKYNLEIQGDFLENTESFSGWAFCIGSLNTVYGQFNDGNKYDYLLQVLQMSLEKVSEGIVFILLSEIENENMVDFPIPTLISAILDKYPSIPFSLDTTKYNGIYKLVVYNTRLQQ